MAGGWWLEREREREVPRHLPSAARCALTLRLHIPSLHARSFHNLLARLELWRNLDFMVALLARQKAGDR